MQGKVCVITGATSGIGRATAVELHRRGANLVLACRNLEKAEKLRVELSGSRRDNSIQLMQLDLSSLKSVYYASEWILRAYPKIDVLINNAGTLLWRRHDACAGLEKSFTVNYLSHFGLSLLLLSALRNSEQGRIVHVSSDAHHLFTKRVDLEDLQWRRRPYNCLKAYGDSKLAILHFNWLLARKLSHTNITTNALHPGVVNTNVAREDGSFLHHAFAYSLLRFRQTPAQGAQTSVYLAYNDELSKVTGAYFYRCKQIAPSEYAQDDEVPHRLWNESYKLWRERGFVLPDI